MEGAKIVSSICYGTKKCDILLKHIEMKKVVVMADIKDVKADLKNIILDIVAHDSEEEWFEFKENWYEPAELGQYISSMSNAAAFLGRDFSYFIWGVNNDTQEIVGTKFKYQVDVKGEPLQHYLARQLKPEVAFEFQELTIQNKRLVVLIIPAASKAPTSFNDIRYIRIGSSKENIMKYPERESQLFSILRNGLPSLSNTESEYQDLTFNKLFTYYETKGVQLNRRTFKKNLGFLTGSGKYNLLAQLLSDDSHFTIRFAVFAGTDKASTMYSVREFGNTCLLYSLDDVLRYGELLNIPQADERNRVVERKEVPLFDSKAYSEAVINAFVHNKWVDENGPMFTGFKNRIEILSRGVLPPKQTVEGFYAGESVPVNEALSKIFIQLHITEHTGRGIPKITSVYGKENIRIKENNILVTIPYNRLGDEVYAQVDTQVSTQVDTQVDAQVSTQDMDNSVEIKILFFCKEPKSMNELKEYLGYKERRSVIKYLKPLIERGRVAMTIPDKPNSRLQKYITIE